MASTVTTKGQVTIPKAVREHLGITAGSSVDFRLDEGGNIVIFPVSGDKPVSRFSKLRGHAGPGPSTDEMMQLLRGD